MLALAIVWVLLVPGADWLARHDVGSATGSALQTARDAARGRLLTLAAGLVAAGALLFTARWAGRSPSTWNVSLDAVRSAGTYWMQQGWIIADSSRMLKRRRPRPDRARALPRAEVEQLLTRSCRGNRKGSDHSLVNVGLD